MKNEPAANVPHPASFSPATLARRLLIGTSNLGKVIELTELLAPAGLVLLSLVDFEQVPTVDETGQMLAENAALKAVAYARHFGKWTLADDTALAVDALQGAPGICTARYAGPQASAADNRRRLLNELLDVPLDKRTAHFSCQLCLADPAGNIRATATGHCRGRIGMGEVGGGGFGYDSLFEVVEYHRTFAQLGPAAKAILSHRARAMRPMLDLIAQLKQCEWNA